MKPIPLIFSALVLPGFCVSAMDRFDALSLIESRNNDHAIGRQREVSRYQILPAFWAQAAAWNAQINRVSPADPAAAKVVADSIMQGRCRAFEARYRRPPTDFEYYILWHRPACFVGRTPRRPLTSAEVDRGRRFERLCQSGN